MYDFPALRKAKQSFWKQICTHLCKAGYTPHETLIADGYGQEFWTAEDIILSQTCGMPFRTALKGRVQLVGTPDYGVLGCPPGYYCSVLVKRRGDERSRLAKFNGAVAAVNEFNSQSGFAALATEIAAENIKFSDCIVTGSHIASLKAVASGIADIASIDAVTWAMACKYEMAAEQLDTLYRTAPTPGLPYICAYKFDRDVVRKAVSQAIETLLPTVRQHLMLRGLAEISEENYLSIPTPEGGRHALTGS